MSIFNCYLSRYEASREEVLTLHEYMELCKSDPSAYASPAERLLMAIGEPELIDTSQNSRLSRIFSNKVIKRYPAFEEFFGMEDSIEQIVSFLKFSLEEDGPILEEDYGIARRYLTKIMYKSTEDLSALPFKGIILPEGEARDPVLSSRNLYGRTRYNPQQELFHRGYWKQTTTLPVTGSLPLVVLGREAASRPYQRTADTETTRGAAELNSPLFVLEQQIEQEQLSAPSDTGEERIPEPDGHQQDSSVDQANVSSDGRQDKQLTISSRPPLRRCYKDYLSRDFLTKAEVTALMETARERGRYGIRDMAMIYFACEFGLMTSELCGLRWDLLDFESSVLRVKRLKNGILKAYDLSVKGIWLLGQLKSQADDSEFIFTNERGGPVTPAGYRKMLTRTAQTARLPFPVHPYMLRHTCGHGLSHYGWDLQFIQDHLGLCSTRHARRYPETAIDPVNV